MPPNTQTPSPSLLTSPLNPHMPHAVVRWAAPVPAVKNIRRAAGTRRQPAAVLGSVDVDGAAIKIATSVSDGGSRTGAAAERSARDACDGTAAERDGLGRRLQPGDAWPSDGRADGEGRGEERGAVDAEEASLRGPRVTIELTPCALACAVNE